MNVGMAHDRKKNQSFNINASEKNNICAAQRKTTLSRRHLSKHGVTLISLTKMRCM